MKWSNRTAQGFSPGLSAERKRPESGAREGVRLGNGPITKARLRLDRLTITSIYAVIISLGRSLTHLLVHAIFSTKDRRPYLRSDEIRNEIYSYMAGTLKNLGCHPIRIGGVEDHIHIFSSLSKNIAFSDLIGRLKGASSKRLKEKGLSDFSWQNGYGAFSVERVEPRIRYRVYPQPSGASQKV
jgi:putative transposase